MKENPPSARSASLSLGGSGTQSAQVDRPLLRVRAGCEWGCRFVTEVTRPMPDGLYFVGVYGENTGALAAGERYSFTLTVRGVGREGEIERDRERDRNGDGERKEMQRMRGHEGWQIRDKDEEDGTW